MTQRTLWGSVSSPLPDFNQKASQEARDEGRDLAAARRGDILVLARRLAEAVARRTPEGTCTADDVQAELIHHGIRPEELGNAAGSIFRQGWKPVGFRQSSRVSNHARTIRVWSRQWDQKGETA